MKINISYQTMQVPPPYAMAFTLAINVEESCNVALQMEYLDRDEIDEDEILAEGFTLDDDYNWKGEIGQSWNKEITDYLQDLSLSDKSEDINHWLFIEKNDGESTDAGHVKQPEEKLNFLQQIIQACFEKAKREAPLKFELLNIKTNQKKRFQIEASFVNRSFTINKKPKEWSDLEKLMTIIYFDEPEQDKPSKKPLKEGYWIDYTSEGLFFKLKKFSSAQTSAIENIIS